MQAAVKATAFVPSALPPTNERADWPSIPASADPVFVCSVETSRPIPVSFDPASVFEFASVFSPLAFGCFEPFPPLTTRNLPRFIATDGELGAGEDVEIGVTN